MSYMNILEKLQVVVDLIISSELLVVTIMLLGIALFLFVNGQISKKKLFLTALIINVGAFGVLVQSNLGVINKIINDIVNKVFMNIYFPSVEVYMFILMFMFITLLVSVVNFKMRKSYRAINVSSFFVMFYLFLNLLYIILTKNIDIFNPNSIYTNKEAVALLELSTLIYGMWIVLISINWVSTHIYEHILRKKTIVVNSEVSDSIKVLKDNAYPETNIMTEPIFSYLDTNNQSIEVEVQTDKTIYSLSDYKTFSSILKQIIILNGYKSQITLNDLLDDSILKAFSEEEQNLYKNMLNSYLK